MASLVKALMAKLFGPDGDRIARSDLVGEALPAERWGWRTVGHVYHPTDGLTVQKLADVCRRADLGDPRAWLEMAEEAEEKDGHYAAVLSTRKRAVMQLPITVEAASDDPAHLEHAQLVRDWVETGCLQEAVLDLLDAVSKSYSVLEIDWQTDRGHFWPKRLIHRPPTWFAPDEVDGQTIRLLEGVTRLPLAPHKFVVHTHRYKSGALIRSGLGRVALWSWMFKMFTARDWALFVQRYGQPIRVGRYGQAASDADKRVLWQAVRDIAGDMAAIIHESTKIDFVETKLAGQSSEIFERRCAYYDQQLSKIVLGQTTTTDAISGGHAVAQEHRQVQEDIERSDGIAIANAINRQLIPQIVAFNFLPQDEYPRVVIGRPDELPVDQLADALDKLLDKGLTVDAAEIRGRLRLKAPEKGAEILGGRAAATPPTPPAKLGRALHARGLVADDEMVARLTDRLERDAAGAMQGLTDEVRSALEGASSLHDALARLERLDLDPTAFAEAMRRGLALAHLAGQAALIDDLDGEE
jgi:phage gp29-like protein